MSRPISLKQRIYNGEITHGCWISLSDLSTTEIMANAGFDWLLLDLEHGVGNEAVSYTHLTLPTIYSV